MMEPTCPARQNLISEPQIPVERMCTMLADSVQIQIMATFYESYSPLVIATWRIRCFFDVQVMGLVGENGRI